MITNYYNSIVSVHGHHSFKKSIEIKEWTVYREMILSTTSIKSGIQHYAAYLHVTMANF